MRFFNAPQQTNVVYMKFTRHYHSENRRSLKPKTLDGDVNKFEEAISQKQQLTESKHPNLCDTFAALGEHVMLATVLQGIKILMEMFLVIRRQNGFTFA